MNMTGLLLAAAIIGAIGIVIGVLLGIASEQFKVEVDEKEILVRAELPGNNCGGCGFPGCDGLAAAIAAGTASVGACPVGGPAVADKIAAIMGVESGGSEKKVAFVKCKGTCDKARVQYNYFGIDDCSKVAVVPGGGEKACTYGCMGYGSCVKASACPNRLIELVPYSAEHLVQCSSHDKGKDVKAKCENGCIACTLCTKQCEFDAIHMDNNVAVIDYSKCTNCGKCAAKCPAKVIL